MKLKRNYELSLWTLQDTYITVLKPYELEARNRIQEPDLHVKDDGTLEFSCKIPMYIHECATNEMQENPIWYNTQNGNLIADMRKLKVIFNKNNVDPDKSTVYEILITKVTEEHEGMETWCEINGEGLDFHELGKIGFKTELNADLYNYDWATWADSEELVADAEPINNIDYWVSKLRLADIGWTYEVRMDWSCYPGELATNKVYEAPYVIAWNVNTDTSAVTPSDNTSAVEKRRIVDTNESNYYNITQTIAETFGVFCRYERKYDSVYRCIEKKVVFYNNFLNETEGPIDINYSFDTEHISREKDSTDLVTKLFVKTLNDENMESGWAAIGDSAANKSGEDYILNFDYLRAIGTISQDQYDEIAVYENQMAVYNKILNTQSTIIQNIDTRLPELEAQKTVAENGIILDKERISAADDLLRAVTNNTGVVEITDARPAIAYTIAEGTSSVPTYIVIRQEGVIVDASLKLYQTYNAAGQEGQKLSNQISSYTCEFDEFGNLKKISHLNVQASTPVYLIYKYDPQLEQENVKKTWTDRLARDEGELARLGDLIEQLETDRAAAQTLYDETHAQKEAAMLAFTRLMGPALREGYWQPEDSYGDYGDKYYNTLTSSEPQKKLATLILDSYHFEGEQLAYYLDGVNQIRNYYPYIDLSRVTFTSGKTWSDLLHASFCFRSIEPDTSIPSSDNRYWVNWPVGASSQLVYLKVGANGAPFPALLLTGVTSLPMDITTDDVKYAETLAREAQVAIVETTVGQTGVEMTLTKVLNSVTVVIPQNPTIVCYPRVHLDTPNLKTGDDDVIVKMGTEKIDRYSGYSLLKQGRINPAGTVTDYNNNYYITLTTDNYMVKSEGGIGAVTVGYTVPNTPTAIYLDAREVSRENAFPKTTYTVDPTFTKDSFLDVSSHCLGRIVHINDTDLKFDHVRGYISEIELNLDKPWEDQITITNYRTKFEDLFSTIVAQTEEMKKSSYVVSLASGIFTPKGEIAEDALYDSMRHADLNYAFNNGTLTIDEENGIWCTSDDGVVAIRGGGIFTATDKDENDNWIWNTGILPIGINADLITTGQLDTHRVRVFAGDDLKLVLDEKGLVAYKSYADEQALAAAYDGENVTTRQDLFTAFLNNHSEYTSDNPQYLDYKQYVLHDGQGIFLRAVGNGGDTNEKGTIVYDTSTNSYKILAQDVDRVAITWDGLTLRDWSGNETLKMDPDTGALTITGTLNATGLNIQTTEGAQPFTFGGTNMIRLSESYVDIVHAGRLSDDVRYIDYLDNLVDYCQSGVILKLRNRSDYGAASNNYGRVSFNSKMPLTLHAKYTLSFWYWMENQNPSEDYTGRTVIQFWNSDGTPLKPEPRVASSSANLTEIYPTTIPKFYSFVFSIEGASSSGATVTPPLAVNLRFHVTAPVANNDNGYICFSDIKVESGITPSAWSAHPEELRSGSGLILNQNEIYMHSDLVRIEPNKKATNGLTIDEHGATMGSLVVTEYFTAPGLPNPYVASNLMGGDNNEAIADIPEDRTITQSLNAYFSQVNNKIMTNKTFLYVNKNITESDILISGISGSANELIIKKKQQPSSTGETYSAIIGNIEIDNVAVPLRFENIIFSGQVTVNNSYVYFYHCKFYGPGKSATWNGSSYTQCLYIARRGGVQMVTCEMHNADSLITVNHTSDLSMHNITGGYTIDANHQASPDCYYFLTVRGGNAKIGSKYPYSVNHATNYGIYQPNAALIAFMDGASVDTPPSTPDPSPTPTPPTSTTKTITLTPQDITTYFNYQENSNYVEYSAAKANGHFDVGYIKYTKYVNAALYSKMSFKTSDFSNITSISTAKLKLTRTGSTLGENNPTLPFKIQLLSTIAPSSSPSETTISATSQAKGVTFEIDITNICQPNLNKLQNGYSFIFFNDDNSLYLNKDWSQNYGGFYNSVLSDYQPQLILTCTIRS